MKSRTTQKFRDCLAKLPKEFRKQAASAYRLFGDNPNHPSLHFKRIHSKQLIYSVRISINYRAVGIVDGDTIVWFWIGTHAEYEERIKQL